MMWGGVSCIAQHHGTCAAIDKTKLESLCFAVPSNERPECTSDQGCFSRDAGDLCVAGVCGNQWRDVFTCNSTLTGTRRCYSGVCGDVGVLGVAFPVNPFACLLTNGNRCQRSEACASQVRSSHSGQRWSIRYTPGQQKAIKGLVSIHPM